MMAGLAPQTDAPPLDEQIDHWTARLLADGYCIIPGLLDRSHLEALDRDFSLDFEQTPFCTGRFYGERTRRFGRLLVRSPLARGLVAHPLILGISRQVLSPWCDTLQLNLTQALALHPGAPPQLPHRDQDMWRGPTGDLEYLVNVMWPFTSYRQENGATWIWPKSHGAKARQAQPDYPPIAAELEPGSALLFLGSTLHGAGGNRSREVRRGAIVSYCLGWLKPYENQWLAYPPDIARHFDPELAALVGYQQHRPNLGNFEGQCPSILLGGSPQERLGAIDALRPDQAAMLDEFVEGQDWPAALAQTAS